MILSGNVYSVKARSYTRQDEYEVFISKDYLHKGDRVLIIDDFLAQGNALKALVEIMKQAGAVIAGVGIVIEKAFQLGGDYIRSLGIQVEALARISSMSVEKGIVFCLVTEFQNSNKYIKTGGTICKRRSSCV